MSAYITDAGRSTATQAFFGLNYAVQVGTDGPIKLGFTRNGADARVASLQQASPYVLTLIAQWPATERHEKRLHSDLAAYRLRGEWYHPVAPVKDRILTEVKASRARESDRMDFITAHMGGNARGAEPFAFDRRYMGDDQQIPPGIFRATPAQEAAE